MPTKRKTYAIKLDAGHDRNGNPRRGWLVYDANSIGYGFVDEGYEGKAALNRHFPNCVELAVIPTTPASYRIALRGEMGLLR